MTIKTSALADPTNTLSVVLGENAWQGDADATIYVDGVLAWQGAVTVPASGAGERIDLGSYSATTNHTVAISLTNALNGGAAAEQRTLSVKDILVNGQSSGLTTTLATDSTATFQLVDAPTSPIEAGPLLDTPSYLSSNPHGDSGRVGHRSRPGDFGRLGGANHRCGGGRGESGYAPAHARRFARLGMGWRFGLAGGAIDAPGGGER